MALAKKGDPKYADMVWAGLIDDPEVLEQERQRRAAPPPPPKPRRVVKPTPRWINLADGDR